MSVKKFRLADFFVILFCVFGAVFFLSMFRFDLNKSIMSLNAEAVGIVQIRYNNVQRRFSDRVLWGRLFTEAPVHLGDLIRVAEHSAATLYIGGDAIDLNANTLIRIHATPDEEGRIIIDLGMGSVSLISQTAAAGIPVSVGLNIMGSVVVPDTGAALTVFAEENVIAIQVNEGSITITEDSGQSQTLETGGFIAMEAPGLYQHVEALLEPPPSPPSFMEAVFQTTAEVFTALPLPQAMPAVELQVPAVLPAAQLAQPAAVVTHPRPNARFVTSAAQPLNITFAWNVLNVEPALPLHLQIAADRNFRQLEFNIEGANEALASLGAGTWHWRLLYQNTPLGAGQFSIIDAQITALTSPAAGTQFHYIDTQPAIRFEWLPVEGAAYYIIQASLTPDFVTPVTRQTAAPLFVEQGLETGTWYWRVRPVFSSSFAGAAGFSPAAYFRIERIEEPGAADAVTPPLALVQVPMSAIPEADIEDEPVYEPAALSAVVAALPLPPPPAPVLLNAPVIRQPASGHRITFEELRQARQVNFSWLSVEGANAYILTFYYGSGAGRRQIIRTEPLQRTEWAFTNLAILDSGTFMWHVEAVNIDPSGITINRGRIVENTFVMDIRLPGSLGIEDIEVVED